MVVCGNNFKGKIMNELEQLTKRASEILGSEEAGQAFVDGFLKEASMFSFLNTPMAQDTLTSAIGAGAGKALGAAAAGLAVGSMAYKVGDLLSQSKKAQLHVKFQTALSQVKSGNKLVKAAPAARVDAYASTIFNFAPHVATDPNLLGSILANVIQGESIDPMTIKMLTELESRYTENNSISVPGLKM